jgi:uncharacterized protein (TIGR03437 family)
MRLIEYVVILALAACLLPPARVQAQETVTATYEGPVVIPDEDAETVIFLPLFVNRALDITDVDVTVTIDHPDIGDLTITLINPTGRTRLLADENCQGVRDMIGVTFDTDAPQRFGDACPPGTQTLRPREEIDNWDDDISLGYWYLRIEDDDEGNLGILLDYTLRITGNRAPEPIFTSESILDAASLHRGAVTSGELVWIVGANLGPADAVWATADPATGLIPTQLGGSSVNIGGVAAPILFTSLRAILVQVPPTLTSTSTQVQVSYEATQTNQVGIGMVAASPGLYAVSGTGSGPVSAINQDGTANSEDNPADRGSVVVLYANGLGPVDPPIPAGQPAPLAGPLSVAVFPVAASVGGIVAPVHFAGLAPGMVGTFQVNVGIPMDAPTGTSVPISITSNGAPSQQLVTISLK